MHCGKDTVGKDFISSKKVPGFYCGLVESEKGNKKMKKLGLILVTNLQAYSGGSLFLTFAF